MTSRVISNISLQTDLGILYNADCMKILPTLEENSFDLVFADPPFNLNKDYGRGIGDAMSSHDYVEWCHSWLDQCVRATKDGGAIFVYNIPKWNIFISHHLVELGLNFRHWIAIEQKASYPIQGKLYPAHYSLLYLTKGKPRRFQKIRTPIETCRHCGGELRDYGGHRHAMNPKGVNLKDIWTDVPTVRHSKFKPEKRSANALSTKIVERVVEIATLPGDRVLDPFGGSGTTYWVCERKHRHWVGIEVGDIDPIRERLFGSSVLPHSNRDYVERSKPRDLHFGIASE